MTTSPNIRFDSILIENTENTRATDDNTRNTENTRATDGNTGNTENIRATDDNTGIRKIQGLLTAFTETYG